MSGIDALARVGQGRLGRRRPIGASGFHPENETGQGGNKNGRYFHGQFSQG